MDVFLDRVDLVEILHLGGTLSPLPYGSCGSWLFHLGGLPSLSVPRRTDRHLQPTLGAWMLDRTWIACSPPLPSTSCEG